MKTQKIRLLLVEDNSVDRMAFERFVKNENLEYDYAIAPSVRSARELLGADRFDVVVSDFMLGDGTAFDVLEMVKDAPVIIVTGTGDEETAVKAMKMGAYDYLVKDMTGSHLKTLPIMVENTLKRKRIELELNQYRENLEMLIRERTAKLVMEAERRKLAEEAQREFSERLTLLLVTINELSMSASLDDLCLGAVERAKERFNFDRVGICFFHKDGQTLKGMYGTDESGQIRDERNVNMPIYDPHVLEMLTNKKTMMAFDDDTLYNDEGKIVGKGSHVLASLWNGEEVVGLLSVDNLIHQHPISDGDKKLLSLYAASLGHLCTLKRTMQALQSSKDDQRVFSDRLTQLLHVTNELSKCDSQDGLCRRAVELARPLLNFDRVGIWFFGEDRKSMQGSFGTDENGNLRDERGGRLPIFDLHVQEILKKKEHVLFFDNETLYDDKKNSVGKGSHVVAGLWNGEKAIGIIGADNLVRKHPITEDDRKMLSLYAASLGHLCTIKKAEESLRIKDFAVESSLTGFGIATLDGLLEYVNPTFLKLFGFDAHKDVMGRNIAEFGPAESIANVMQAVRRKGFKIDEAIGRRRDRTQFDMIIAVNQVTDAAGKPIRLLASFVDISEQKKYEKQLLSSLSEKEVLLKEIHHRVKNNMQVIVSLLNLQSTKIKNKRILSRFKESQDRIYSMALVHEMLYGSDNLSSINFREYIRSLVHNLYQSYGVDSRRILFEMDAKNIAMGIDDAVPCGLIIQELISNALKYAFPKGRKTKGKIQVTFRRSAGKIELSVADNGVGLPAYLDLNKTKSLGLNLVSLLGRDQLSGSIKVERIKGTKFTLRFKESKR
jgi:PAS domain S-box-containing protein